MELYLLWIHHSLDGGWTGNKNPIRGTVGGTRWESQQQTLWHVHARTTHTFFRATEYIEWCVRFGSSFEIQIHFLLSVAHWRGELGSVPEGTGSWLHPGQVTSSTHTPVCSLWSAYFTQLHFAALPPADIASAQAGKRICNEFIFVVRGYKNINTIWKIVSKCLKFSLLESKKTGGK